MDVLPRLGGRERIWRGLGAKAELGFDTSQTQNLRIWEVQPQMGLGYEVDFTSWLQGEVALLAGALVHLYRGDASLSDASGTTADFLGTLFLSMTFWLHPALGLEVRVAPGLASHGRRHEGAGGTLWERGPFRLEAGIGGHCRF